MTIFLEDSFDSAHSLPHLPLGHKCRAAHGHTYKIRLEITGALLKKTAWVMDYSDVKREWDRVKRQVDHQNLNLVIDNGPSTCENVARWIWKKLKPRLFQLSKIEIRETERCGVVYSGE